jgi:hypothetical protein
VVIADFCFRFGLDGEEKEVAVGLALAPKPFAIGLGDGEGGTEAAERSRTE